MTMPAAAEPPVMPATPSLEFDGFCYDNAPLLAIQWFTFYDCRKHRQAGNACTVCSLTGEVQRGVFRAQINRILADNFDAFKTTELIDKDPSAMTRWISILSTQALVAWEGMFDDAKRTIPTPCSPIRKEMILLRWNAFRMWVWQKAIQEDAFRGNSLGDSVSLGGGERVAA